VLLKPLGGTQWVPSPTRQSWPAAGSESCAASERSAPRSVDSECMGRVIEPREGLLAGADVVEKTEGSTDDAVMAWRRRSRRGRRAGHVHAGSPGTWESQSFPHLQRAGRGNRRTQAPGWQRRVAFCRRDETATQVRYRQAKDNEARREGRLGFGVSHSTDEPGEPTQGIPGRKGDTGSWNR